MHIEDARRLYDATSFRIGASTYQLRIVNVHGYENVEAYRLYCRLENTNVSISGVVMHVVIPGIWHSDRVLAQLQRSLDEGWLPHEGELVLDHVCASRHGWS